jgi:hypothetical protein
VGRTSRLLVLLLLLLLLVLLLQRRATGDGCQAHRRPAAERTLRARAQLQRPTHRGRPAALQLRVLRRPKGLVCVWLLHWRRAPDPADERLQRLLVRLLRGDNARLLLLLLLKMWLRLRLLLWLQRWPDSRGRP